MSKNKDKIAIKNKSIKYETRNPNICVCNISVTSSPRELKMKKTKKIQILSWVST